MKSLSLQFQLEKQIFLFYKKKIRSIRYSCIREHMMHLYDDMIYVLCKSCTRTTYILPPAIFFI